MAIDAHSTAAPADHRALLRTHGAPSRVLGKSGILSQVAKEIPDLPPSFIGAVPVATPALTAETVAMLDEASAEIGENPDLAAAAEVFSDPGNNPEDVRHAGAPSLASARHMRRALEGALDHGTVLLAALGLPRLTEPGFVPLDPAAIGDALDTAIATLDALDAPRKRR